MSTSNPRPRRLTASLETNDAGQQTLHRSVQEEPRGTYQSVVTQEWPDRVSHNYDALVDIGWEEDDAHLSTRLVEGLENQDVWRLMRRFNKEIFHIKASTRVRPGQLDFNVVPEEDFSPNKLRAQFERLYMGVLLGLLATVQHVARIRSWVEPRRTGYFCLTYFITWYLNLLITTILSALLALIFLPEARSLMFPPAPVALVDYETGTLSKPQAGVLVSTDSATGAPENVKGEAVENEASNFVTGLAAIAINTLTDKDPQHSEDQKGGGKTDVLPEPNSLATKVAVAKDKASGSDKPSQDKTKVPMEKTMWSKIRPIMHLLCVVSDTWERFANLLNPTLVFPKYEHRARLAYIIGPLIVVSLFTPVWLAYKVTSFMVGFVIFGDPILTPIMHWMKQHDITLDNTLLKGVPTDAQLTITLLRLSEAQMMPFPPPPLPKEPPSKSAIQTDPNVVHAAGGDQPLGASQQEIEEAAEYDHDMVKHAGGGDDEVADSHGKKRAKLFGIFKHGAKGAAKTMITTDKVRAKSGAESAQKRLGATSTRPEEMISGPVEFSARYNGERGYVYLTTDTIPSLCFVTGKAQKGSPDADNAVSPPLWTINVEDIRDLNKYSGYGTKSKLMAGWALEAEVKDGIEITDAQGNSTIVTSVPKRDQLFNRLCAIGKQRWEVW